MKGLAEEFMNDTIVTLDRQWNSNPCIYYYNNEIKFSPGNQMGGEAESVYNKKAEIVVNASKLRNLYDEYKISESTWEECVNNLHDTIKDCLSDLEVNVYD